MTRRELLARGGRVALVAGAVPFGPGLVELASAKSAGIFEELAHELRGDLVRAGAAGYDQARVLFDTRFDAVAPRAVVFCESLADVERTVRWARRHAVRIVPRSGGHSYGGGSTPSRAVVDLLPLEGAALHPHGAVVHAAAATTIGVCAPPGP